MIFAQRPDAIACAEYDLWKKRMRRYVWRGLSSIRAGNYWTCAASKHPLPLPKGRKKGPTLKIGRMLSTRTYGNTGANMNRLSRRPWNRGLKFQAGAALYFPRRLVPWPEDFS